MSELRRVFITGASSGLGAELARRYAVAGATIGLNARRAQLLDELAGELRGRGARVEVYPCDVSDTDAMGDAARRFVAAAGGADLVVANAGVGIKDQLKQGEAREVAWLVGINVIGVTNTIIPFIPSMIAQRAGVLCAVGSFAGHRAVPGRTAYSATKAAVKTFMDGLRMDLAATGVHAMTICPGFVRTPLTEDNPRMIFPIDVEPAVDAMVRAIDERRRTVTFPWQMNLLKELLTRAPEPLLRRVAPPSRTRSSR